MLIWWWKVKQKNSNTFMAISEIVNINRWEKLTKFRLFSCKDKKQTSNTAVINSSRTIPSRDKVDEMSL